MKRWIIFGIKLIIALGLVSYFVGGNNFSSAIDRISQLDVFLFAGACGIFFLEVVLLSLRWAFINDALGIKIAPLATFRLCWIGSFFSQTLPSTFGGDAVRIWYVCRTGVSLTRATSSILLDRILALAMLIFLVGITLPLTFSFVTSIAAQSGLVILVAGGGVGFLALVIIIAARMNFLRRWRVTTPIADVLNECRRLAKSPRNLVSVLAIDLFMHLMTAYAAWLISEAVGGLFSLEQAISLVPPVIMAAAIPISVAGWGVREGAMVVALGFIAIPEVDAASVSVLLGFAIAIAGIPGGLVWLVERSHDKDIRKLGDVESRGSV